jgi:hypothetical protein
LVELRLIWCIEVAFVLFGGNPKEFLRIAQRVSQTFSVSEERKMALENDMGHRGMPRGKAAPKIREDTPQARSHDFLPLRAFPDDLACSYGTTEEESVSANSDEIFVKSEPPPFYDPQLPLPPNNTIGQYSNQQYAAFDTTQPVISNLAGMRYNGHQLSSYFIQGSVEGSHDDFAPSSEIYSSMQSQLLTTHGLVAPQVLDQMPPDPAIPLTNCQFSQQAANFILDPVQQRDQVQPSPITVADNNLKDYGVINLDFLDFRV